MRLSLIETGGTINGILSPDDPPPGESRVLQWLDRNSQQLDLETSCRPLMMRDSRAISEEDRHQLAAAIHAATCDRILIPHGTYTMPQTGRFLRQHLSASDQARSVVLVGSLIPLNETGSDAPENLLLAIDVLRSGQPGVWLVMDKEVWNPEQVEKDLASGKFVECG